MVLFLGIDPGLNSTGWGVVNKINKKYKFVDCGIFKTELNDRLEERLRFIFDSILNLIQAIKPDRISIERVFVNINPASSEKLIMARTASFLAIAKSGYIVNEFAPNEIKKIVTGNGRSSKKVVKNTIQQILNINIKDQHCPTALDATDALAVALCLGLAAE